MMALVAAHGAVGLVLVLLGRRIGRQMYLVAAAPHLVTLVWLAAQASDVLDGETREERASWVGALGLGLDFRLDGFAVTMTLLVSGIGLLVVAYSWRYFNGADDRLPRRLSVLTLFAGSMLGLVLADNLFVLYGFWELTSVTSFLLIADDPSRAEDRSAAFQALLVTGLGGLAMFTGFILLGQAAGTYRLSELVAEPPRGGVVPAALVLVVVGALTKSAQFPFHGWLPAAMVAPTPVSAYLHSATMVKAGVYLVARLAPAFATVGLWRPIVVTAGLVTMIWGGVRALRQTDLKALLALGTVSQLGLMMAVFGWGSPRAVVAGSVLLLAHGAYKAAAFMVVGILDQHAGGRDISGLPRLTARWRGLAGVTIAAAASMAGAPLLFGFVAKEAAFDVFHDAGTAAAFALAVAVAGSALTAAYSIRFAMGATGRLAHVSSPSPAPPSPWFVAPAAVLAVVTVVFGCWPGLLDSVVEASAAALQPSVDAVHLSWWHGLTAVLGFSLLALAAGTALAAGAGALTRLLRGGDRMPSYDDVYAGTLRALDRGSMAVTSVAQPGALPIYLGVILATAAIVPAALLATGEWWQGWPDVVDNPAHVIVAALLIAFALAAAVVRRRFTAALCLGMTGYAMAALFVVQGAPDLAVTQVAIETLTTVLFVLVLRRLPDRFEEVSRRTRRALRGTIAAAVAAMVFAFTLAVGAQDPPTDVSDTMIARSYPEAEGRNVVNVILTDMRGYDTLGELTVLAAAAIGAVALARAGRGPRGRSRAPSPGTRRERLPPPVPVARLVTIEVSVRVVFAAVMAGSLWLLFAGHNQPGGGFVGGIVAGAAIALRYVAGGIADVRRLSRGQPWVVLGAGVLLAAAVAAVPFFGGGSVLEASSWSIEPPLLGTVKVSLPLLFDIGVYIAVLGLAMMVFESFGDDPPPVQETAS